MSSPGPLADVARTALAVARVRARESRRPDRLFDDPYASAFVAALPDAPSGEQAGPGAPGSLRAKLGFHAVIRTRFFDDFLLGACAAGCRQVVLLAAGLDTRAFRLPWPAGVRLFELDRLDVLDFKDAVLSRQGAVPRCGRTALAADLREDWPAALVGADAGFEPGQPTAWLAEGLLVYLSADDAAHVLSGVGALCAPGSRLSLEGGGAATSLVARASATADPAGADGQAPATGNLTSLWKGGLGKDSAGWLTRHGWQTQFHELARVAASYGRPAANAGTSSGFITAAYLTSGPPGC